MQENYGKHFAVSVLSLNINHPLYKCLRLIILMAISHQYQANIASANLDAILKNKTLSHSPVFKFSSIQQSDLLKTVNRTKSKAKGHDGVSAHHLSLAVSAISQFLLKLFNISLQHGEFPQPWKMSHIFPLIK